MSSPVLKYYDISPKVTAFSTTRHGGCGVGEYATLNVNEYCGDAPACILANRKALCRELAVSEERLVMPHQTHGTEIRMIAEDFMRLSPSARQMVLESTDALMTDGRGICIGVSTADCTPIIIYDAGHHAAAVVHAGWRGTVAGIVEKTVRAMAVAYGSEACNLVCCIGPCISIDNFEVGQEVYEQFAQAGHNMEAISRWQGKWHIDLKECNRRQMLSLGVPDDNITVSGECTFSDNADFFSARKQGRSSGRMLTGIILK